jgi:hypothetical protein
MFLTLKCLMGVSLILYKRRLIIFAAFALKNGYIIQLRLTQSLLSSFKMYNSFCLFFLSRSAFNKSAALSLDCFEAFIPAFAGVSGCIGIIVVICCKRILI